MCASANTAVESERNNYEAYGENIEISVPPNNPKPKYIVTPIVINTSYVCYHVKIKDCDHKVSQAFYFTYYKKKLPVLVCYSLKINECHLRFKTALYSKS